MSRENHVPDGATAESAEPAVPTAPAAPAAAATDTMREQYRQQLLQGIGGLSGTIVAALPPLVFVLVNTVAGLGWAVAAALATGLVLAGYRLLRKQPVQQALFGLVGVAGAAAIAAWTGQARGYFLIGIWTSFVYAGVFLVSVLARRPLVGAVWEFLDPTPGLDTPWYRVRPLLLAYSAATLAATCVFLARGLVQQALFDANSTGWLAVARLAMGYPLSIAAAGIAIVVVRRARSRVVAT